MPALEKGGPLKGSEAVTSGRSVSPDIYNWEARYNSALERLENDSGILDRNSIKVKGFMESRMALSILTL